LKGPDSGASKFVLSAGFRLPVLLLAALLSAAPGGKPPAYHPPAPAAPHPVAKVGPKPGLGGFHPILEPGKEAAQRKDVPLAGLDSAARGGFDPVEPSSAGMPDGARPASLPLALRESTLNRVEEMRPWLEVKLADSSSWDATIRQIAQRKIARLERRRFDPHSFRLLSFFKDSDTVAAVRNSPLKDLTRELDPEVLDGDLDLLFSDLSGHTVVLLGHAHAGQFVAAGADGNVHAKNVKEIEAAARRQRVFLLPLGCGSAAEAALGAAHPFNSLVAVGRISNAYGAQNLGDFLGRIAGPDLVLRFDATSLADVDLVEEIKIIEKSSGKVAGEIYIPPSRSSRAPGLDPPSPGNGLGAETSWSASWFLAALALALFIGFSALGPPGFVDTMADIGNDVLQNVKDDAKKPDSNGGCVVPIILIVGGVLFADVAGNWAIWAGIVLGLLYFAGSSVFLQRIHIGRRTAAALGGAILFAGLLILFSLLKHC
jgi:hypothetical protein